MLCLACGHPVQGAFCANCGMRVPPLRPTPAPAPMARRAQPRVPHHLRKLGVLWCVFGVYRVVEAVLAAQFLLGVSSRWVFSPFGPVRVIPFVHYNPWLRPAAPFLAAISVLGAVISLVIGFALLRHRRWGRPFALVIGILILIRIPIGTALGIYTLWVLAPAESAMEYDAIAP